METLKAGHWRRSRLLPFMVLAASVALQAQAPTQATILRPPPGVKVALVEFADLQCPDCARAAPLLDEAVEKYHIPLVVYAFPLPQHSWAFEAAVYDQYFRSVSTRKNAMDAKFRSFIYQNQSAIAPQNLREYVDKFARAHHASVPRQVDPKGKLAAAVKASRDKGVAANIVHTPTIFVVTRAGSGTPFVEVVDRNDLFAMIERAQAGAKAAAK